MPIFSDVDWVWICLIFSSKTKLSKSSIVRLSNNDAILDKVDGQAKSLVAVVNGRAATFTGEEGENNAKNLACIKILKWFQIPMNKRHFDLQIRVISNQTEEIYNSSPLIAISIKRNNIYLLYNRWNI